MKKVITGQTRILGIIGDPIAQVKAPEVWTAMFARSGLNMICIPIHVRPADLEAFFAGARTIKNLSGLIVTIPHKPAAVAYVDKLTKRAEGVQSVNFISIDEDGVWTGDITDGIGFVGNLRFNGVDPAGKKTLLVGAGGVGTAIAFALAEAGVSELVIYDASEDRAKEVARRLRDAGYNAVFGSPDPVGFDLVVNATPIGMKDTDPLPIDVSRISSDAVVADVIVEWTRLLELSRQKGCRAFNGVGMMNHQLQAMIDNLGFAGLDFSPETVNAVAASLTD